MTSWIDRFVEYAAIEAESPEIYRRWTAITTIAAVLEQKVWINSPTALYPNMYTILVGHPGVGKSRTLGCARRILATLNDFPFAPTSVTMASLVDSLKESERQYSTPIGPTVHYNSMMVMPDDLQVLMSSYDLSLVAGLTTFYDVDHPYREQRRTNDLRVEIQRPQLSILGGTTPSHLLSTIPEEAWTTGFTSRLILVYADEKTKKTVRLNGGAGQRELPSDLCDDLAKINNLVGEFTVDERAIEAFEEWIEQGEAPIPQHKRLEHYLVRRYPHLLKLCMVSAVDRGNDLRITIDDFNRALTWLIAAEDQMPKIFQTGPRTIESRVMDEVYYFMKRTDPASKGIAERRLKNFLVQRVSPLMLPAFWDQMIAAGYVKLLGKDLNKDRIWVALERQPEE